MANTKVAELREQLENLGESPPKRWTRVELMQRLEELTGKNLAQSKKKAQDTSEYQTLVKGLNRASRLKADLVTFCQNELGFAPGSNLTMAQIKREAMYRVYDRAAPDPTDAVGFGKHSSLTYEEVKKHQPQYCSWVLKTAQEGECDPRLRRLAGWLNNSPEDVEKARQDYQKNVMMQKGLAKAGYPKEPPSPREDQINKSGSQASASSTGGRVSLASHQLEELIHTMKALQEDVSQLKEERPRKKGATEETDGNSLKSFSMASMPKAP